ncbi:hypothetical protein [Litorimonas cladophorae]|uniref:hypothetical protein n=1 Tax=Litorimonas cladophorae TaxID=1220491 RepID=UPI0016759FA4|nr:hypothetical protein [Litorimonas cladophorae]
MEYHKAGAPVREYKSPPTRPRELFWARFWLFAATNVGGHYIYLKKTRVAVVWIVCTMIYWISVSIWHDALAPSEDEWIYLALPFIPWLAVIAFEYRRLPEMVRQSNTAIFGKRAMYDPRMQGNIGPYGAMRPVCILMALSYICILVLAAGWPINDFVWLPFSLFFLLTGVAIVQYTRITKRHSERLNND